MIICIPPLIVNEVINAVGTNLKEEECGVKQFSPNGDHWVALAYYDDAVWLQMRFQDRDWKRLESFCPAGILPKRILESEHAPNK